MADLTTLAAAKDWLTITGGSDDVLLQRLVSAVSAAVERRIGRAIASAAYTETQNGTNKSALALAQFPVTAVASVTVNGAAIAARTSPVGAGYSFDDAFLYLSGSCFPVGRQNVVVQYTAGYPTTPADLEQAALEIIGHKYRERGRIGESSKILGGETVGFLRDVPPDCLRVIDKYQRWR